MPRKAETLKVLQPCHGVVQIQGRGNGIKTEVVNNVEIAKALDRLPECMSSPNSVSAYLLAALISFLCCLYNFKLLHAVMMSIQSSASPFFVFKPTIFESYSVIRL